MHQETIDYLLKSAWQNVFNKYNQIAAEYEITQAIGYMLINIEDQGTPVSKLAALHGVKATSLSRMLNNMEELGLIYREMAPSDKRSNIVRLTEFGKDKRKIAKSVVKKFNEYLNEQFSEDEREKLSHLLIRLSECSIAYKV